MKSPPADIFVWGVHPETTPDDIVNDLATSGIIITNKDIQKKSKAEATLNSFKISIPAADFEKALNPELWPLRVRVCEYFYNSKKPKQHNTQQQQTINQQVHSGPRMECEAGSHQQSEVTSVQQQHLLQVSTIPTENRFDALANVEVRSNQ